MAKYNLVVQFPGVEPLARVVEADGFNCDDNQLMFYRLVAQPGTTALDYWYFLWVPIVVAVVELRAEESAIVHPFRTN